MTLEEFSMTTILIILFIALFVSFGVLLYAHITEKQLEKEILKMEREMEQGRTKPAKELCEELTDYYRKKSLR